MIPEIEPEPLILVLRHINMIPEIEPKPSILVLRYINIIPEIKPKPLILVLRYINMIPEIEPKSSILVVNGIYAYYILLVELKISLYMGVLYLTCRTKDILVYGSIISYL